MKSAIFPSPKQGKKNVQIGRPVSVPQRVPRNANPLTKAIWVSKFHPETKPEEVEKYIIENTEVKDATKFKCTMLIKKDADISKMSFVSYKIDASPEVYDTLIDPENWPSDKHVREFVKLSPPKLAINDFMPLNERNARTPSNEIENNDSELLNLANELGITEVTDNTSSDGNNSSLQPKN